MALWVKASFSNGEFDGLILMFHWQEKIFSQGGKGTLTWNSNIGKKKKKENGSFENMYIVYTANTF